MKKFYLLFGIILLVSCSASNESNQALNKWQNQAENVTIIRDDYGVPHIYGKTDADVIFGMIYAQCEDDFPRVERNYAWAIGRLAETEGEKALYSDLRARMFMTLEEAKAYYETLPKWLKKLCIAWSDGINYYLHTHPEIKPKVFEKFEAWMPLYFTEGSIGGDIERVSVKKIQAFYEGLETESQQDQKLDEPKGSNGFALSGALTTSGNPMLLINPHTSFYFRGELHLVSEEGLNAYGAVTWGQFFIYQGFNEKTGWMHTSTYTDVIDEFKENIIENEKGLFYQYGKEQRPIETKQVKLKFLEGNTLKERILPIYRTHHGPITHQLDGKWVATALMWKPVKALEQSYIRTKTNNLKEFHKMMEIRTNSSNNTVFADSEGNIAYYHGNFIPIRNTKYNYLLPVNGDNPDTDWKGNHTLDEIITVINPPNGWIQNCNSSPFSVASEHSPKKENFPDYMSTAPENFRSIHAVKLLKNATQLTLDSLIKIAYDPYLTAFEKVIPGLIDAYQNSSQDTSLKEPIEVLKNWNMKTGKESVGMSLSHFYGMNLYKNATIPNDLVGNDRFNYFGTDLPQHQRLNIFKQSIDELQERFDTWNIPWGEVCRFQRLNGAIDNHFDDDKPSIPIGFTSARWGALAAYEMITTKNTNKVYGTRGNSFVAVVEFGKKLKAKSLLVGGQSSHPTSSHFGDQVSLYTNAQFKEVAFYKEDVEARAEETYSPGNR